MSAHGTRRLAGALLAALAVVAAAPSVAIAPAATVSQKERAVRWAFAQVGVTEIGDTECGPKITLWQQRAGWRVPPCRPWCGAFVHEAFLQAGINLRSAFLNPERVLDDARAGRNGLRAIPVRQVRRGDLVLYAWGTGKRADHFGIVTRPYRAGQVSAVEGNAGQAVRYETRAVQLAVTGVRVLAS